VEICWDPALLLQGYTDSGIASWSGNDDEAHAAVHDHGAAGVISVTSNVVPGLFAGLMRQRDDAQNQALQVGAVGTVTCSTHTTKPSYTLTYRLHVSEWYIMQIEAVILLDAAVPAS
jgi:dihydrodipicolinate synthase/N-acetylneuraminate lyase